MTWALRELPRKCECCLRARIACEVVGPHGRVIAHVCKPCGERNVARLNKDSAAQAAEAAAVSGEPNQATKDPNHEYQSSDRTRA